MTASQRLRRLLITSRDEGRASTSDLVRVFTLARESLEEIPSTDFSMVKLYADWLLHSKLDRRSARNVLAAFDELAERERKGEVIDWITEVSRLVSTSRLRAELLKLFSILDVPTFVVDDDGNWYGTLRKILTELAHKPLIGAPETAAEARTGIANRAMELRLVTNTEADGSPIEWEIMLGSRLRFKGRFKNT